MDGHAAPRRHARVGRGSRWITPLTVTFGGLAMGGLWITIGAISPLDVVTSLQAALFAAIAAIPLGVLVARLVSRPTRHDMSLAPTVVRAGHRRPSPWDR